MKIFKIEDEDIKLCDALKQNKIAKECYDWLKKSVEIRTAPKKDNHKALIHGKMYYIEPENPCGKINAVVGSSNFTSHGLGIDSCLFDCILCLFIRFLFFQIKAPAITAGAFMRFGTPYSSSR